MRPTLLLLLIIATSCALPKPRLPDPRPRTLVIVTTAAVDDRSDSLVLFHDALKPFGDWSIDPNLGWVWTPDVQAGWRPYAEGRWMPTSEGLSFASEEPWAWAAYHYGRWTDTAWGWSWAPGTLWSPAWVAWRHGDAHTGWAALPPAARFITGEGFAPGTSFEEGIAPMTWVFVANDNLLTPFIPPVMFPTAHNPSCFGATIDVTRYTTAGDHLVNHSIDLPLAVQDIVEVHDPATSLDHALVMVRPVGLQVANGLPDLIGRSGRLSAEAERTHRLFNHRVVRW